MTTTATFDWLDETLISSPRARAERAEALGAFGSASYSGSVPFRRDGEVKAVLFHINRISTKKDITEEQRRAGVEMSRQSGAANPAVKSYVVGPEVGGEFDYSAVYVVEDLDGYWAYLSHPAHVREELEGISYIEKFVAYDVTDSDDPEIGQKIAQLQARHMQESPELAALVANAPSFTVPGGAA